MPNHHIPAIPVTITLNTVYLGADGALTPLPEPGRGVLVYDGVQWFSARRDSGSWIPQPQRGQTIKAGDLWSFLPVEGPRS